MVSTAQAVEGNFQVKIKSVLLGNPTPAGERFNVVSVLNLKDAEHVVSKASLGQAIRVSFFVQENVNNLLITVYNQDTDIVFPAGQTEVIVGTAATGRIVAKYDAAEMTFSARFALRQDQETSVPSVYFIRGTIEDVDTIGADYSGTGSLRSQYITAR